MRWALIDGGVVQNVVEQPSKPQVPGQWIACGNAAPGWTYDGRNFVSPQLVPAIPVVTRRQALRALHAAGLLDTVERAISQMQGPQGEAARIDWANATEFKRDFPLLVGLATALGLTAQDIDNLFAAAAAIE